MSSTTTSPSENADAGSPGAPTPTSPKADYNTRRCDLVMKGGISSGLVYPGAIANLSEKFDFEGIGGTSAGAIAAALVAAAEYGRWSKLKKSTTDAEMREAHSHVQRCMDEVDSYFRQKRKIFRQSSLRAMFQPIWYLRPIFSLTLWLLQRTWFELLLCGLTFAYFVGRLVEYALKSPSLANFRGFLLDCQVTSVVVACVLFLAACLLLLGLMLNRVAGANNFGFCLGHDPKFLRVPGRQETSIPGQFTDWLHYQIQTFAGKELDKPLTFSDLKKAGIDFKLFTTNLSQARPYVFPYAHNTLSFKKSEFLRYFPPPVVEVCVCCHCSGGNCGHDHQLDPWKSNGQSTDHVWLASGLNLPILVATRISSSFPVVFSAVPLYCHPFDLYHPDPNSPDYPKEIAPPGILKDLSKRKKTRASLPPEKCLFADGGICCNLPIHFFDDFLPSHPTFGINLGSFPPGYGPGQGWAEGKLGVEGSTRETNEEENEKSNVRIATHNNHFSNFEVWNRFSSVSGFLMSIVASAMDWRDNGLLRQPGYRDRVAHVALADNEGGLNLNMDVGTIRRLQARGRVAGKLLKERFAAAAGEAVAQSSMAAVKDGWKNHQYIRYLTVMNQLAKFLPFLGSRLQGTYAAVLANPEHYCSGIRDPNSGEIEVPKADLVAGRQIKTQDLVARISPQQGSSWNPEHYFDAREKVDSFPRPPARLMLNPEVNTGEC